MSYLKHFALAIPPFASTPDPSFFFPSHDYSNIVASLEFAIRRDFGIVKLVGEDGTGKTTLSRLLQGNLARDDAAVAMLDARAAGRILPALCACFGLQPEADHFEALRRYLLSQHHFGRLTVAIIDEAHHLEPDDFKALVRLERLEAEKKKLLQIVLLGHSQLDERLALPESGELARYIVFSLATQPLNEEESRRYLLHRLRLARPPETEDEPQVFADTALEQLARWGGGKPYVLNLLAESALQKAGEEGAKLVLPSHVLAAARAYPGLVSGRPSRLSLLRGIPWSVPLLTLALVLSVITALLTWKRESRSVVDMPPPPPAVVAPVEAPKPVPPPTPPKVEAAKPIPAPPPAAKIEPPKVEAPKPPSTPPTPPKVEAPKVEPPKVEPPKVEAKPVVAPQPEPKPQMVVKPKPKPVVKPVVKAAPSPVEQAPPPSHPGQISPDDAAPPPPVPAPAAVPPPAASQQDIDLQDAKQAGSGVYPGKHR